MFIGIAYGDSGFIRDIAAPFVGDVAIALASTDLLEASSADDISAAFTSLPAFPPQTPIASAGHDLMVGVGLYFTIKAADVVVEATLTDFYLRRIKPITSRMWSTLSDRMRRRTVVRFDHWFDDPGLLVRVEFRSRTHDSEPQVSLVLEAVRRATAEVDQHGLTHRVLAFTVIDGELKDDVERLVPVDA